MLFDKETVRAVAAHAARLGVDANALLAICEVEADGVVFANVAGRDEPLIRWEGHYFDKRLTNGKQALARKQGLASPKVGGVKNPASQAKRWGIVARASKISQQAALESISIGLGQVMGAHWKLLGFASVMAMVEHARQGATEQIDLMIRYIEAFGLVDEIQRLDFRGFTRGYNGPGGIKAGYHTKMQRVYERLSGNPGVASKAAGMLRMGSTGPKVRELQAMLIRLGYPVKVDGDYGPSTKAAVMQFQKANGIEVDGVAGPETQRVLSAVPRFEGEAPGAQSPLEVDEVKSGGGTAAGGGGIAVAADKVQEMADKISPTGTWLDHAVTALYVVAAILVVGGLAWAAYGWWKSRRTHDPEDDVGDIALAAPDLSPVDEVLA